VAPFPFFWAYLNKEKKERPDKTIIQNGLDYFAVLAKIAI
jgi:hypothetical protein